MYLYNQYSNSVGWKVDRRQRPPFLYAYNITLVIVVVII